MDPNDSTKTHLFHYVLDIANKYYNEISKEMNIIYDDLKNSKFWNELCLIKNVNFIERQDHENVGLLSEQSIIEFKKKINIDHDEKKDAENGNTNPNENIEIFIDMHVAPNILM
eukprot:383637_1